MRNAALLMTCMLTVVLAGYAAQGQSKGGASAQTQSQAAKVTDPVCGMQIDQAKAAGKSDYRGKTYYFCSDHCKKTFDANPDAVLNKESRRSRSGFMPIGGARMRAAVRLLTCACLILVFAGLAATPLAGLRLMAL